MSEYTITIDTSDLSITHNFDQAEGKTTVLNKRLMVQQCCTEDDMTALLVSHVLRASVFEAMNRTDDPHELQRYDRVYKHLQRAQQELWKFQQNDNYLRFWDVPKCGCPKMDNDDAVGTPYKITSAACVIHWKEPDDTSNEPD